MNGYSVSDLEVDSTKVLLDLETRQEYKQGVESQGSFPSGESEIMTTGKLTCRKEYP